MSNTKQKGLRRRGASGCDYRKWIKRHAWSAPGERRHSKGGTSRGPAEIFISVVNILYHLGSISELWLAEHSYTPWLTVAICQHCLEPRVSWNRNPEKLKKPRAQSEVDPGPVPLKTVARARVRDSHSPRPIAILVLAPPGKPTNWRSRNSDGKLPLSGNPNPSTTSRY